jgi:hypothetical protein
MSSLEHHARRFLLCSALAAALGAGALTDAGLARAAPSSVLVIPRPAGHRNLSYFKLTLAPRSSGLAGAIELRNPSARRLVLALAPVDGMTLSTLGSTYSPSTVLPSGAASWLRLGVKRLTLPPGRMVDVPVGVAVPRGARSGDYLSGVSVEQLGQHASTSSKGGLAIESVDRYAIGVEIQVPGPRRPLLRFTGARAQREPAGLTFFLFARNPGNVILQGVHGAVSIERGEHPAVSAQIEPGTFVSGTGIAYPVNAFGEHPHEGDRYRVSAWLRYTGGIARLDTWVTFGHRDTVVLRRYDKAPAAAAVSGTPWWEIALAVAVIIYALVATVLLLWRRRRRTVAAPEEGG